MQLMIGIQMTLRVMMRMSEQEWDYYSGLPSPLAYEKRKQEKKMEEDFEDGVVFYSPYPKKTETFNDELDDE